MQYMFGMCEMKLHLLLMLLVDLVEDREEDLGDKTVDNVGRGCM